MNTTKFTIDIDSAPPSINLIKRYREETEATLETITKRERVYNTISYLIGASCAAAIPLLAISDAISAKHAIATGASFAFSFAFAYVTRFVRGKIEGGSSDYAVALLFAAAGVFALAFSLALWAIINGEVAVMLVSVAMVFVVGAGVYWIDETIVLPKNTAMTIRRALTEADKAMATHIATSSDDTAIRRYYEAVVNQGRALIAAEVDALNARVDG